jgi:para-nitrobenzyl esterase
MMRRLSRLGLTILLLNALSSPAAQASAGEAPTATAAQGAVRGVTRDGVDRFEGLPYAAAPIGDRRWAAPAPPVAWRGVRDASVAGPRCPQTGRPDTRSTNEDCLTLNIARPSAPASGPRAVLVYVHGGAAVSGAANDHDGAALARDGDIVVVSVNYRLGALGFMTHPAFAAEDDGGRAGNYGVMDVAAALGWVRDNIAAFGGDPAKVTLAGESAGGTVICPLLAGQEAGRLFRAAIVSSDDCLHDVDDLTVAIGRGLETARALGCEGVTDPVACLRARPVEAILTAGGFAAPHFGGRGAPDAAALDRIIRSGRAPIPIIIGATREEGRIGGPAFLGYDHADFRAWLRRLVDEASAARIEAAYPYPEENGAQAAAEVISRILTDSGMRGFGGCATLALSEAAAAHGPAWLYEFADIDPPMWDAGPWRLGAAHSAELAYLWPDGGAFAGQSARFDDDQRALALRMRLRWGAFVRTLSPNAPGLADWRPLDAAPTALVFQPAGDAVVPTQALAQAHRCDLWRSMPWIMDRGEG